MQDQRKQPLRLGDISLGQGQDEEVDLAQP